MSMRYANYGFSNEWFPKVNYSHFYTPPMTVINRLPRFDLQELPSSVLLSILTLRLGGGRTGV